MAPIPLGTSPGHPLDDALDIGNTLPRWHLVSTNLQTIHWEVPSRLFGFVDDVHLWVQPGGSNLNLRAAARVGYWDLGQNRRHLERFQDAWRRAHPTTGNTPSHLL